MPENVANIDPRKIVPNPENPRLIFREDELRTLEDSIKLQGILVPLAVYEDRKGFVILDGERRWRCAIKLGLNRVPAIVQPKPGRMQNIMMMFAIHNARRDWDPLPTALKLRELEEEFSKRQGRAPTEAELSELASMRRGEVRRLRNLLGLPESYRAELMEELEKPRSRQIITVDHVLEATRGAAALRRRDVIDDEEEDALRKSIIAKFRSKVINNTVSPRKLARIARSVQRGETSLKAARAVTLKLIRNQSFSIDDAFKAAGEQVDFEHNLEQLTQRLDEKALEYEERGYELGPTLKRSLRKLQETLARLLRT